MVKVICIDDSNSLIINYNRVIGKLLTIGKIYDAYTGDDLESNIPYCPFDSYYMVGDDGYPILSPRNQFKILRESNLDILLGNES